MSSAHNSALGLYKTAIETALHATAAAGVDPRVYADALLAVDDLATLAAGAADHVIGREANSAATASAAAESIDLAWRTAADVGTAEDEGRVEWVVYPWLALGSITELDGLPKAAGKTTLALHMARAVLDDQLFLGGATRRGPVVLLTEERDATLRQGLARAGLLGREDLHILRRVDAFGVPWVRLIAAARRKCRETRAVLLLIDTLTEWAQVRGDEENSSGAASTAMEPLQLVAHDAIAVLVLRHERKSLGNVGESARGSNAFTGAVDVVMALRRLEAGGAVATPAARRIEALSRFGETPPQLIVELTPGGYVTLGTATDVEHRRTRAAVLDAMKGDGATGLTIDELMTRAKVRRTTCTKALEELRTVGCVETTGRGVRGDPHRYRRLSIHSAASRSFSAAEGMEASSEPSAGRCVICGAQAADGNDLPTLQIVAKSLH